MKGSAVVAIGVDRHAVGRDNGARWHCPRGQGEMSVNFACTAFSGVRYPLATPKQQQESLKWGMYPVAGAC
jgi:hypothetical protein